MFGRSRNPAEKRKDCRTCQGTGKFIDVRHYRDRTTGRKEKERNKVRCPTCKGRGYR